MKYPKDKPKTNNEPPAKEPVKVVLADDDKDDQEIFAEAINQAEIRADLKTVDNGKQLLDHLKDPAEPNPDIIFMDINMPVKDGREALKEIKTDETLKDIPTIMLSTSDHPKDVDETFNAGASLYVRKPYSFRNFVLLLKKIFSLAWTGALLKPIRRKFFLSERSVRGKK